MSRLEDREISLGDRGGSRKQERAEWGRRAGVRNRLP